MKLLGVIPQGHEKALKQAFYNALALFVLLLCGAAGWALFYIFEPFVKPLIWALLIGSVLYPVKHSLANQFESWFQQFSTSSNPIFFSFFMIPIHVIDEISETVGNAVMKNIKLLGIVGIGTLSMFLVHSYTPCTTLIGYIWYINSNVLLFIIDNLSVYIFIPFIVLYFTILIFYWNEENKQWMTMGSYVMWLVISLYTAKIFGVLQIPLFLFILFALSFGFAFEVFTIFTLSCEKISCWKVVKDVFEGNSLLSDVQENEKDAKSEKLCNFLPKSSGVDDSLTNDIQQETSNDSELKFKEKEKNQQIEAEKLEAKTLPSKKPSLMRSSSDCMNKLNLYACLGQKFKIPNLDNESSGKDNYREESSKYIYGVVWLCVLMMVWKNFWIIHFFPILIAVYLMKHLGLYFGFWGLLHSQWLSVLDGLMPFIKVRELAIFPPPIQGLYKFCGKLRISIMNGIHYSINSFASSLVIFGLILFTFSFSFFIAFQIYAEGIHLITVGAEVINSTVVNNPEFLQLLPEGWGDKMETVINNAYIYGREGISKQVQHLLRDVDKDKAVEFEKYVLELWDRIYQAWVVGTVETNSNIGPKVNTNAVFASWENFLGAFHKMPDLLNITMMTEFAKENVGTLLSLLESIWNLLKGNVGLIFQFLFASFSLVLGGGTVVLNFFLSTLVFFTALFYLLSSSGTRYKPVEWLANISPISGRELGNAFETAVNGVFKASFKMALFYGLWTWLIHNFFQVRIVYLPSVLAAVLGAVPFLGTYWASIPAVLDLWLAQRKGMQAIILFVFQFLPISFVDTAIYKEIKEGHPYITGLAIAGGVFCMGIQGAIFGPVLLCSLRVALNMSWNLMKESPIHPALASISMEHLRRFGPLI